MANLKKTLESTAQRLERAGLSFGHGTDNAWDDAAALVLHAMGLPLDGRGAEDTRELTPEEEQAVDELVERRILEGIPAAYLIGRGTFAGLYFKVDRRALVPRSPIGELIPEGFAPWVRIDAASRVLDLCTGGGCIAVATAVYWPHLAVEAVDISPDALQLARENAALHDVSDRVNVIESDLFDRLAGRQYELIVANPPYVGQAEYDALPVEFHREPPLGLQAGPDGLDIVLRLLADAPGYLSCDGCLICEVGHSREALEANMPQIPFLWLEFAHGGEGVFLLEGTALDQAARQARAMLSEHPTPAEDR